MVGPRRRQSDAEGGDKRRMIQIYVPRQLRLRMQQVQSENRLSNAELVLGAIEETHQALVVPTPRQRVAGTLFSRSYRPRKAATADAVQVGIRLLQTDIDQIDHLVSTSQTASRSAYIVAALNTFLADHPQEEP